MISGGVRGVGIVTFERIDSTLCGVQKAKSFFSNPRRTSAQCSVVDGQGHELLSSPLPRDTVESASDLTYLLQRQYLSLKKEGGVQEWRPLDLPVSRRWPVSDIAVAAGSMSEETVSAQGEQIGTLGNIDDNVIVDDELSSEEGQSGTGFKLDLVEAIKDITRQAEKLKEDVASFDYTVSPTPFTPVEGAEAVRFVAICVLLLFVFWLGNYYVPDLIFKDTVFRKKPEDPEDPLDPTSTTSGYKNPAESNEESRNGLSDASNNSEADAASSAVRSGAGFSGNRKQNRRKSAKRK